MYINKKIFSILHIFIYKVYLAKELPDVKL
jgi:hypothetical protein